MDKRLITPPPSVDNSVNNWLVCAPVSFHSIPGIVIKAPIRKRTRIAMVKAILLKILLLTRKKVNIGANF